MSALLHTESVLSYFSATNDERAEWGPKRCAKCRAQVFDRAYFVRLNVIWKPDGEDTVSVLQVCKSRESIEAAFSLTGWLQGFHFEAKMDACAHFFLMPPCPRLDSYITPMSGGMQAPAKARAQNATTGFMLIDMRMQGALWCMITFFHCKRNRMWPLIWYVPVWRNGTILYYYHYYIINCKKNRGEMV